MKRILIILFALGAFKSNAQLFPNLGGQRAGVAAYSFLKSYVSPVSSGLAGSSVGLDGDGYSVLHNPAAVGDIKSFTLTASNLFLPADIHQSYLSALLPLKKGSSTIGFTL